MKTIPRDSEALKSHDGTGRVLNVNGPPVRLDQTISMPSSALGSGSAESDQNAERFVHLSPYPLIWFRKILVSFGAGYLILSSRPPVVKGSLLFLGMLLFGTFCTTLVSNHRIIWKYRFLFMPIFTRQLRLSEAACLQSHWEESSGLCEALLLGTWGLLVAPFSDWLGLMPGGQYRLWIKSHAGKRTLVWRGRVPRTFHQNNRILVQTTGLTSHRIVAE